MKIVRFKKSGEKIFKYGSLENEFIYQLEVGPFESGLRKIGRSSPIKIDDVILGSPCEPTKIVALAINYKGATGESKNMSEPLVFIKGSNSVTESNAIVKLPFNLDTWGEAELGIVILKKAKNVPYGEVSGYILGYVPANDISCKNIQQRDHHLARSKSADEFCPLGQYIDTDYDPKNKTIRAFHNDILLRSGNTNELIWSPQKAISELTSWMTLYPGDVVLTGTPPRVRDRMFLKRGDTYTVDIEGFPKLLTEFINA